MPTYVIRNGELVDKRFAEPQYQTDSAANVISDTMDSTRHMADGNYYESKSEFRKATKAAGCIEYGSEIPTLLKPRKPIPLDRAKRRDDIRRAIYELRNGIRR
jgi:hypothetical protein